MRFFATILSILLLNTIASAQNAGGITDLLKANVEGPVVVMDLVKFKPGGEEKYAIYDGLAEEKLKSLGGAVVRAQAVLGEARANLEQAGIEIDSGKGVRGAPSDLPTRGAQLRPLYRSCGFTKSLRMPPRISRQYTKNILRIQADGGGR